MKLLCHIIYSAPGSAYATGNLVDYLSATPYEVVDMGLLLLS